MDSFQKGISKKNTTPDMHEYASVLAPFHGELCVVKRNKAAQPFQEEKIKKVLARAAQGIERHVALDLVFDEVKANIFHGISTHDLENALIMAATAFIEKDTMYSFLAARLLLHKIYKEVMGSDFKEKKFEHAYQKVFKDSVEKGVAYKRLDPTLLAFDVEYLGRHLQPDRDYLFKYYGLQPLYQRYLMKIAGTHTETPQMFWMRIAMGLALNEQEKEKRALEFYEMLSSLRFVSGTPTLFHSGTTHPQLSSCYLTTVDDDLEHIFKCFADNAQLSKWSGGVANDWTNLRATGALIKSINVTSQGVVPFLKIANDVTGAINRSGSRRGATVVYLEVWHFDFEDFIDLRKNTGDERRRTHDLNIASWIPDLFMKRVLSDQQWTFFSPDEVPDLHHLYGKAFEERYELYERKAREGGIRLFKVLPAKELWRKMLTRLFETGYPWIVFKDPCNIRSPQDHVGVVHSSNLCTEITLNTSKQETAVCNLGSVNLAEHITNGVFDKEKLAHTVEIAMRMLDNVIDINFYPTQEAEFSNKKHRPVGLGIMGFQDALFKLEIPFSSPKALAFADMVTEFISYHALLGSSTLAKERGTYKTYKGSKWDRGIFPVDTLALLEHERGVPLECSRSQSMDWENVREHVKRYGMRNSNTMAIAPTATISNIAGCFPCIEPIYKNVYVKSNTDGEFTILNEYLVEDLKALGLWDQEMCEQIKYYDGSIQQIQAIPDHLKEKYKTAFEIDPEWLIKITAARGKWIDQSQSHNVFMQGTSGRKLNDVYFAAWRQGLKSTYYLRSLGATQVEKSTLDAKKYGFTQKRTYGAQTSEASHVQPAVSAVEKEAMSGSACGLNQEDCESCQ